MLPSALLRLAIVGLLAASIAARPAAAQAAAATGGAEARTAVTRLLPTGAVTVDVMELAAHPDFVTLMSKLQAAARREPAWWGAHVRSAPAGQPLAYDARMGLTEAEYRRALALGDSMQVRRAATATLTVRPTPTGVRLGGDSALRDLDGLEIDTLAGVVRTPFGDASAPRPIRPSAEQRATGPWTGVQWKREDVTPAGDAGTVVTFSVGRLVGSGRTLLYYDAKRVHGGALVARVTRILMLSAEGP